MNIDTQLPEILDKALFYERLAKYLEMQHQLPTRRVPHGLTLMPNFIMGWNWSNRSFWSAMPHQIIRTGEIRLIQKGDQYYVRFEHDDTLVLTLTGLFAGMILIGVPMYAIADSNTTFSLGLFFPLLPILFFVTSNFLRIYFTIKKVMKKSVERALIGYPYLIVE